MNLHNDKEVFNQYLMATASYIGLNDTSIVEKDYFITLLLKRITERLPGIVFKGGTSLSKCYKIINRFSEDIDLSMNTKESGRPTEGQRKKLKQDIVSIIDELGFSLVNPGQIKSRRDFNKYVVDYLPASNPSFLNKYLIVETEVHVKSFPTVAMSAASFVHDFLYTNDAGDEIMKYGLEPFNIQVQSVERTFIDKMFAIADYYLSNQAENHSRHIYDLYKIYPNIIFDEAFKELVEEVRKVRASHTTCHSAKDGVDLLDLLRRVVDEDFYKSDYNHITDTLLFERIPYSKAIATLQQIIEHM